jgi:hypothetical protein
MSNRLAYKRALQIFQTRRLRRDHQDLARRSEYRRLAEFLFTDIYGPRDFSERDRQMKSLTPLLRRLPGLTSRDMVQIFQLLSFSDKLDEMMVDQLLAMGVDLNFDEATYEEAYRLAGNYADRARQLDEVHCVLLHVHQLARNILLGPALDSSHLLAGAAGLGEIHTFLQHGYHALRPVRNIAYFVDTVDMRERERLERIFLAVPAGRY